MYETWEHLPYPVAFSHPHLSDLDLHHTSEVLEQWQACRNKLRNAVKSCVGPKARQQISIIIWGSLLKMVFRISSHLPNLKYVKFLPC